jgi:PPOX class probable F420-dependent enzyme
MDEAEQQAFLDRPLAAVIATVSRDGGAHSVPVWFTFRDNVYTVWTDANRRWVKNAQANPRVSISIAEHEEPYAAVVVRGEAEVRVDPPDLAVDVRRIVEQYIAPGEVDAYIEQWSSLRTIVRIVPTTTRAWGRGY